MIFGHEDKVDIFKDLVANKKLRHAYLFYGDDSIGKFLFAKHLAHFLEFGKFEISNQTLLDTQIFEPNEKNSIGIEEAREIKRFLSETPLVSPRRLAIIDRVDTFTPEAQTSLLKIVEVPPLSALIIFITYDPQVLFPPLLSRLNKIYFRRLSKENLKNILQNHFEIPFKKAEALADQSFGRLDTR